MDGIERPNDDSTEKDKEAKATEKTRREKGKKDWKRETTLEERYAVLPHFTNRVLLFFALSRNCGRYQSR